MEPKTIAVRLESDHLQKLEAIAKMTGWNQSEIIRRMIDSVSVTPPSIRVDLPKKVLTLAGVTAQ